MTTPFLGFFILAQTHQESSAVLTRGKQLFPGHTVKQGQVYKFSFQPTQWRQDGPRFPTIYCSLGKPSPIVERQQFKENILQNKVLLGRIADILVSLLMHHQNHSLLSWWGYSP